MDFSNEQLERYSRHIILKEIGVKGQEKRCGTVQQLDAEHYCFSAAVYDARELLPWIRTFIGRITAFSCSNEEIERIFYDDLEQTAAYYLQEVQADGEK